MIDKIKLCILDNLGCAIFGASLPAMQKLISVAAAEGAAPEAAVFGVPPQAKGCAGGARERHQRDAFQLDDIRIELTLHPGSLALPAALALAEANGKVGGRDLIAALVAGYEVGIRVGLAAKGGMFKTGFHNQGTTSVFVAAAGGRAHTASERR